MNKGLYLIAFACGAAAGACGAWFFLKNKYEKMAQEEIDSVKEVYTVKREHVSDGGSRQALNLDEAAEKAAERVSKPDVMEYAEQLSKAGYTRYSQSDDIETASVSTEETRDDESYIISPDDFGDQEEFDRISLTYYADGVLAYENDDVIEEENWTVPSDFMTHFGEYEDDSVFVRNEALKTDYEILADSRTYEEATGDSPRDVEVQ